MSKLYIYLLSQSIHKGYDTFDSCVVCAESSEAAKMINPSDWVTDWDGEEDDCCPEWCTAENVQVELIGTADEKREVGLICSSYNAG